MSAGFLPDRFRPRSPKRRTRRTMFLIVLLPVSLAATPWWRVQAVDLSGCVGLPGEVVTQLHGLVGRPALLVGPQRVRRQLEVWPEVAAVEIRLELPGTLRVTAQKTDSMGCVPVGRRWHAVNAAGELAGALDRPIEPILEGIRCESEELRRALSVARRVAVASGARVEVVRQITPSDYELRLWPEGSERPLVIHVRPDGSAGERYWCERIASGDVISPWADLRWEERIVLGGVG